MSGDVNLEQATTGDEAAQAAMYSAAPPHGHHQAKRRLRDAFEAALARSGPLPFLSVEDPATLTRERDEARAEREVLREDLVATYRPAHIMREMLDNALGPEYAEDEPWVALHALVMERDAYRDETERLREALAYGQHLRQYGERAPGGNETWQEFDRLAEHALRGEPGWTDPRAELDRVRDVARQFRAALGEIASGTHHWLGVSSDDGCSADCPGCRAQVALRAELDAPKEATA